LHTVVKSTLVLSTSSKFDAMFVWYNIGYACILIPMPRGIGAAIVASTTTIFTRCMHV